MASYIGLVLFVCLSVPAMLAYSIGCFSFAPKKSMKVLYIYAICLALIAYCYIPTGTTDLYRYINVIMECGNLSLGDAIKHCNDGLYITDFVFWLAGTIKMPTLVTAISMGIVYGIAAYIAIDSAKRMRSERRIILAIFYQFAVLHFFYLANNLRNVCAFTIMILAAYKELVQKKRGVSTWLLYICPCFIHRTGILIVLVRLLVIVARKSIAFCMLLAFTIPSLILWLFDHRNAIPFPFIKRLVISGYAYTNTTSRWASIVQNSGYQRLNRLVWTLMVVLIILFCIYIYRFIEQENYVVFVALLSIVSLTFILLVKDDSYLRFSSAAVISYSYCLIVLIHNDKVLPIVLRLLLPVLAVLCILEAILQIWFDRYMVDWVQIVSDSMITNIYVLFVKVLMGVLAL